MALTINPVTLKAARASQANFVNHFTIDLDASYPVGGYPITDIQAAIGTAHEILHVHAAPIGAYYFGYDRTAAKLMVFQGTAGANQEVPDTTDLQTVVDVHLTVFTQ